MNVLVTGGAGFIGSHVALRLLEAGHTVTIVDNLSRGHRGAVAAIEAALGSGAPPARGPERLTFVAADVGARDRVVDLLRARRIDAVMHFAALAYVGESVDMPLAYYQHNLAASIALLQAMDEAGVRRLVFSSTCATYGEPSPEHVPISEECPQRPVNPYGRSKLFVERVIEDHLAAQRRRLTSAPPSRQEAEATALGVSILRYFNVAGADRRGRLGEDHRPETHLIPICLEVAEGRRPSLTVHGQDYPTPDGTCVRDYVHVDDLAEAHLAALDATAPGERRAWNVGIGRGHSVLEVVEACRRVTGHPIPVVAGPRRAGDPPVLYADASRLTRELGWKAQITDLDEIVASAWRWRQAHPRGYG